MDIRALFALDPVAKGLIHGLKYRSQRRHGRFLAGFLRHRHELRKALEGFDAVVPVPLHPLRKRERGFNQAEVIGSALARTLAIPMDARLLRRLRHTATQTREAAGSREGNLAGAFAADPERARHRRLLLVDDVYTTGATLRACETALRAAGASSVGGLCLARALEAGDLTDYRLERDLALSLLF